MTSLSRYAYSCAAVLCCTMCFIVLDCKAQTTSPEHSDSRIVCKRIAAIFRDTLRKGEMIFEQNGHQVKSLTFVSPSTEYVDEIRRYGDKAIPALAEYLNSSNGFEKYLAMRFLGLIGGSGVVESLSSIALGDSSPSFRSVALLWLTETPWELAYPIIRQAAENDTSVEVREKAKEILAQRVSDK